MDALDLLRTWDRLRFGLLLHRAVADVTGLSTDLSAGFGARAERAFDELEALLTVGQVTAAVRADALRRQAALAAYLGHGSAATAQLFVAADTAYRSVVAGESTHLSDEFSRTLMSLERSLTLRATSTDGEPSPAVDKSKNALARVGLSHLADVLRADELLNAVWSGASGEGALSLTELASTAHFPRERAQLAFASSIVYLNRGDRASAFASALAAKSMTADGHYGVFDQAELQIDLIVAALLNGTFSPDPDVALKEFDDAVGLVEEIRGGWRLGASRSDPMWLPLETVLTIAVRHACESSAAAAGWTALRMMEAMRRRHLAGMLRSMRFQTSVTPWAMRSPAVALSDLVSLQEDADVSVKGNLKAQEVSGVGRSRLVFSDSKVVAQPENDDLFATLKPEDAKAELERLVSDFFADAFLPDRVSVDELRHRLEGRFSLEYLVIDGSHVARVWTSPQGEAHADIIDIDGLHLPLMEMELEGYPESDIVNFLRRPLERQPAESANLVSERLLPLELVRALEHTPSTVDVVVIPDGWLSRVPWPALRLRSQARLISQADVIVVPAVSLLTDERPLTARNTGVGACISYLERSGWEPLSIGAEQKFLQSVGVSPVSTISEWTAQLLSVTAGEDPAGWAYFAGHGDDAADSSTPETSRPEIGVALIESDGTRIGLVELLAVPWPDLVVFGGCFTSRLGWNVSSGLAPLGLAVAAMAGGASSVIGGSSELLDDVAAALLVGSFRSQGVMSRYIESDEHPSRLLAVAQRQWLASVPTGSPALSAPICWARTTVVTRYLPE